MGSHWRPTLEVGRLLRIMAGVLLLVFACALAWRAEEPTVVAGAESPERPRRLHSPAAESGRLAPADMRLTIPVAGVTPRELTRQFDDARGGGRRHRAIDILAPRHTPVLAASDGRIAKLHRSERGGIAIYQFDPSETLSYYYAHLEAYAEGIREGALVREGQVIGYVGTSGNAPENTPHLHFAVMRLTDERRWWQGTPIDPYDMLVASRFAQR